jgi:hypothetical protein
MEKLIGGIIMKQRDNKGRFIKGHKINTGKANGMYGKPAWNKGISRKFNNALDKWRQSGGKVWNKGLKGIHLSPNSEFKKGRKHTEEWKKQNSKRMKGKNHPNYIDGRSKKSYPSEFTVSLKYKVRTRDNFECQNCGMTEEEHLSVYGFCLEVHHIDYNKKNNKLINLITLCKQCNIRANYNRKYWRIELCKEIKQLY